MDLPLSVLSQVTSVFEQLGISYVLVGSLASSMHGMYRSTADIDILADIKPAQVDSLVESLKSSFYIDEHNVRDAADHGRSFNAIHFDSVFKVDVFVSGSDEFATAQLNRRELRKVAGEKELTVYVASAEDTILAKLSWFKAGNETSNTQWRDVLGVLGTVRERLDQVYLQSWANTLGLTNLLQKALSEVRED